jgi:hypothetical protein
LPYGRATCQQLTTKRKRKIKMENRKKYIPLLNVLKKLKPAEISGIIDFLNDDAVDNICECVYNVIHTDLNLPKQKKNKLKNFIKANCSIHRINKIASKKENRRALKWLPAIN